MGLGMDTNPETAPPLPAVLISSPVRYRPECPEVLAAFFEGIEGLDYAGPMSRWLILQDDVGRPFKVPSSWDVCRVDLQAAPDSRYLGGPRSTGETQENLAYLRNRILRRFEASKAAALLMVDSDVVLRPEALTRMVEAFRQLASDPKASAGPGSLTLSLQIDNRVFDDDPPAANAEQPMFRPGEFLPYPPGPINRFERVPYRADGSVTEVWRSGAVTLYPRAALARRFRWDPRYNEEHQGYFDDLRELGFRHYLLQDPSLSTHLMVRQPGHREALRIAKARLAEADRA